MDTALLKDRHETRQQGALRWVMYGGTAVAALTAWAQLAIHFQFYVQSDDNCDYPEECLTTWFPKVFTWADQGYFVFIIASIVALMAAALLRGSRTALLIGSAAVAVTIGYALTPRLQNDPISLADHGFLRPGPTVPPSYLLGMLLIGLGALACTYILVTVRRPK